MTDIQDMMLVMLEVLAIGLLFGIVIGWTIKKKGN